MQVLLSLSPDARLACFYSKNQNIWSINHFLANLYGFCLIMITFARINQEH